MVGIPCQVYAARSLENELGFEKLFIIGSPCSDNTTTEKFHQFLGLLSSEPETISYLEFRADYHVEIRFENGQKQEIPFLKLPLSDLPADFSLPPVRLVLIILIHSLILQLATWQAQESSGSLSAMKKEKV